MAIKQYHIAVFAEVDTDTGKVLRVETDSEVLVGAGGRETVYNATTEDWEREEWDENDEAQNAHEIIHQVLRAGNKAVLNVEG